MKRGVPVLAACVLALAGCSGPTSVGAGREAGQAAGRSATLTTRSPQGGSSSTARLSLATRFSHVVVVVMENKEFGRIIGSPNAPYINSLANRYGLATSSFALAHPSLPNYLALLGGSTFGITSDCTQCHVAGPNLIDQLERAGISWKAYLEGYPSSCFTGAESGEYGKRHEPFMYFDDIVNNPARCSKVVPLSQLNPDLSAGALPRFAWISPDLCHDMHDCSVAVGDRFLSTLLPPVLRALGPSGVLFLTWDEGSTDVGCCGVRGGGHVATIVAGPAVIPGARSAVPFTHYSILRTIEDSWGLPPLSPAGCLCAEPMTAFFAGR
jgi:hypothetical protein